MLFVTFALLISFSSFASPLDSFATSTYSSLVAVSHPLKAVSIQLCPTSACSTNWGGYAVTGSSGSVTDVKGSWIVPSVTCTKRGSTYAALWVGIDGFSSGTVEQTGVLMHCANGRASYSAWYEFYPAGSVTISGFSIAPRNKISAEVSYSSGTGEFTTTITNVNTGKAYSTSSLVGGAQESSGEWITERPEVCTILSCKLTTLSNFGIADFGTGYTSVPNTNYATVNGITGPISSFTNVAITMVSSTGSTLALPSSLSSGGTSFTMQYH